MIQLKGTSDMVFDYLQSTRALLFIAIFAVSGVASQLVHAEQTCTGKGIGLAAEESDETKAAIAAQAAAEKLSLGDLFEKVAVGDSAAQVELGLRYVTAKGVAIDADRAYSLFRTASVKNNPVALYYWGTAFANGVGVEKSDAQATLIWEDAARAGYGPAQYWLGFMIANGRGGMLKNWCAAIPLFEIASEKGISDAAFMVGIAYNNGEIGTPDYAAAADWYRKANAIEFNQKAQYNLRLLIEKYLIEWQKGDPGKPAPPKPEVAPEPAAPDMKLDADTPATN